MIYVLLRMKEYNEINTREGISFSCPREQQYLPLPHERVIVVQRFLNSTSGRNLFSIFG